MNISELIRIKAAEAQRKLSEENIIPREDKDHLNDARFFIGEKMYELVVEIRKEFKTAINEVLDQ